MLILLNYQKYRPMHKTVTEYYRGGLGTFLENMLQVQKVPGPFGFLPSTSRHSKRQICLFYTVLMCKCECDRFGSILALCAVDQNGDYFLRRTSEEGSSGGFCAEDGGKQMDILGGS